MAGRIARVRSLLPSLESALKSFTSSNSSFKIIQSISPPLKSTDKDSRPPAPRTLFILDSSYNPPSRAHLALASTAISSSTEPSPYRLLFLFSTHNADKAPSPASFSQRLAMMILCAEDFHLSSPDSSEVVIDIGLTTSPYYTDKSLSITQAQPAVYPSQPTHVHLLGYDTLTRFLAPKYYTQHSPPLSALSPYFDAGHKLAVLLRPSSSSDNAVDGATETEQRAYVSGLREGSLEAEGLKREWADQIGILEGERVREAEGISSTVIRKAAKMGRWDEVGSMCTPGVAAWIRDQRLYEDDAKGAKMA